MPSCEERNMKIYGRWFPIGLLLLFCLSYGAAWCSDESDIRTLRGRIFTVDCQVPETLHVEMRSPGSTVVITSATISTVERRPIADLCVTSRDLPHVLLRFRFHPLYLDAPFQAILPYRAYVLLDGFQFGGGGGTSPSGDDVYAIGEWSGKVEHGCTVNFGMSDYVSSASAGGYEKLFHLFADIEQSDYAMAAAGTYIGTVIVESVVF